ncbi:GNAT family N-acetyltransferase [Prolixibacteraceae bacterium]|nr:GNAT family N-acetyltransferase [Prolixibacteraceae bacterium]
MKQTDNFLIREIQPSDYPSLIKLYRKKENMSFIPGDLHKYDEKTLIERWEKHQKHYDKGFGIYSLTLKSSDVILGEIGLFRTSTNDFCAEIGIIIDSRYWGKGLGSRSCEAHIQNAYSKYGINQFIAQMYCDNQASLALVEKLQFKRSNTINYSDGRVSFYYQRNMPIEIK